MDLARFERATSTFAESRSHSAELQVRETSDFEFRIADFVFALCISLPGVSISQSEIRNPKFVLEEGTGVEPASDKRAEVFGTTALPVRLPFQEEFRIANCGFAPGP